MSNDEYNKGLDIIAVPLTSTAYRTAIPFEDHFIKTDVIQTIERSLITAILGYAPRDIIDEVKRRLLRNL